VSEITTDLQLTPRIGIRRSVTPFVPYAFMFCIGATLYGMNIDVIAIRYVLDGPGIETAVEARFSAPAQTDPGKHTAYCKMSTGSLCNG
jgi:hypothetical protein